jgi:hypothetical protein
MGVGVDPRPSIPIVLAGIAVGSVLLIATASLPSLQVLGTILAFGGLAGAIALRDHPAALIGTLMFLALSSLPTVQVASVNIRVEQPAVVFLSSYVIFRHRLEIAQLLRRYAVPIAGLAMWVAAATVSSIFVAPEPIASLRIVVWLVISLAAAAVAGVVAFRAQRPERVIAGIVVAAVIQVGIALLAAASGRLLGVEWGGFERAGNTYGFRAFGIAWEPNIFASGTAIALPLAMAQYLWSGRRAHLASVGILGVGIWVAVTRTVFVAVALGVFAFAGMLIAQERPAARARMPRFAAAVLAVAVGLGAGILVDVATSTAEPGFFAVRTPTVDPVVLPRRPVTTPGPAGPVGGAEPPPTPSATASNRSLAPVVPIDLGDTTNLDYRLVRLRQSFGDLPASPWIGLGANSFGQRHANPTLSFIPDYLGMLPFTVLYDAGLIGFAGYLVFFGSIGLTLLRWRLNPISSAFAASLAIMLISYVMTDALRFASNWIVIGAALGLACRWRPGESHPTYGTPRAS